MRKTTLLLVLIAALMLPASCASSANDRIPVQLIPPRFRVRQIDGQFKPSQYRNSTRINLLIDVYNDSAEPIVLKRIRLQSLAGNLEFRPAGRIYHETIAPHDVKTVDIWVVADLEIPSGNPDEPIRVRGAAIFESEYGKFSQIFMEPVIEHGRTGQPR